MIRMRPKHHRISRKTERREIRRLDREIEGLEQRKKRARRRMMKA